MLALFSSYCFLLPNKIVSQRNIGHIQVEGIPKEVKHTSIQSVLLFWYLVKVDTDGKYLRAGAMSLDALRRITGWNESQVIHVHST